VDDVLLRTIKGSFKYNYETSDSVKGRTFLAGVPISLPRKSVQMKWLKNLKNN